MTNRIHTSMAFSAVCLFCLVGASAQPFETLAVFPSPAPGSYTVVGTGLDDGRFVVWNGDRIFVQTEVASPLFAPVASGYAGDPAFASVSPDGSTLILGGGFTPKLYRLTVNAWQNHTPATEISVPTHFSGVFLDDALMALDRSNDSFTGTEIIVVDIGGAKGGAEPRVVLATPEQKDVVIDKPPFSYSGQLAVDDALQTLYAMDSNTRELRSFAVADIVNAYNTAGTLDWSNDGTLIGAAGTYFNGGPSGALSNGDLVIGGAEGFGLPGGIHIVDPGTGAIEATLDPTGTQQYVSVIFNPVTDDIIALDGFTYDAYVTTGSIGSLPAHTGPGLLILLLIVLCGALRRLAARIA